MIKLLFFNIALITVILGCSKPSSPENYVIVDNQKKSLNTITQIGTYYYNVYEKANATGSFYNDSSFKVRIKLSRLNTYSCRYLISNRQNPYDTSCYTTIVYNKRQYIMWDSYKYGWLDYGEYKVLSFKDQLFVDPADTFQRIKVSLNLEIKNY